MSITYEDSGVSIFEGEETVRKIKHLVHSTFNEKVLSDIGFFGGLFDAKFSDFSHPVLVASTDGVGTKLKIAFQLKKHDTIGQCLVNHCVNDILACGAKPLFFLDYFATGKLNPDVAYDVIAGFAKACRESNCALIGGEIAEMPSFYQDGEYDISGTIVGIVEKSKIIDGKNIRRGDFLIGLKSNGLHTNGYSLARKVLLNKYDLNDFISEIGSTLGEELLKIHKSYLPIVYPLLEDNLIKGISHITGGGIVGNTQRILPQGLQVKIDWNSWEIPPIFKLIQSIGGIEQEEMRKVFNLGIGLILVVDSADVDKIILRLPRNEYYIIGEVV
ncbi:MAG: phosphoribosylformylglycinamidine cyclo-ligase [Candidatus Kapaibacteriales bacterium]